MGNRISEALALFLCMMPGLSAAQSFTLEQVMSAPFNSGLKASPVGDRFVWASDQEGRNNLWLAESDKPGGEYRVRALTHYDKDDGQQLDDVAWMPDGSAVAYVRGGDFEFPAEPAPNPDLTPGGVKQQIWLVAIASGEPRLIAEGHKPAISPDGETMAYLLDGQVWTIKLRAADAKPQQQFHGRGPENSLRWSPDGRSLAFVSHRGDHNFIGVYSFDANQLSYLAPGTFLDGEPAWSPDSRRVAFLRMPPDIAGHSFGPERSGTPWSIVVADAKTGDGHEIWRAQPGPGSVFHNLETANQIDWGAEDRIVFPWEADGWSHLYSVPTAGGKATLLTPGEFEVEHVTLSPDRATVFYSSNEQDVDRRHIWSAPVRGGSAKRLTRGEGIEVSPAVTADGSIAVLRSDAHVPMRPALVTATGEMKDLAPDLIPAGFPAAQLITPQPVLFNAADGMQIHGQLFLPAHAKDGKQHPAVVFFHGGSRRQMLLGWHYMRYYSNAYAENQYLASLGYIVLSVNYRSGIGYGLNFREALNYGATGASEFNDVLGAGLYLRSRADVDGAHIGSWGGSYGGYLTALALAHASDLFAAGVDMHGVHDWNLEINFAKPAYRADLDQQADKTAWESSPMSSIKGWRSPVLLMQGDDDRNVVFAQTVQLAEMLRKQGTPYEEHIFPDEIHDFLLHRTWVAAYGYEADFFERYLKAEKGR
jgi:dipeptidyl aminopeptidase/acylaminoacyl peptidase